MAAYTSDLSTIQVTPYAAGGTAVIVDAVGNISISMSRQVIDITQVGALNSRFVPSVFASALSLDIYYNKTDHVVFTNLLQNGTLAEFVFTAAPEDLITCSGFVTGSDIVASMGDIVRGSVSVQITGNVNINGIDNAVGFNEYEEGPAAP